MSKRSLNYPMNKREANLDYKIRVLALQPINYEDP